MFEIKYKFADDQIKIDKNVDEMTLRYELFPGSLTLEKEDKRIEMDWEWIPLLDFALCLGNICDRLGKQTKGEDIFEFTESDATITFRREDNVCTIDASFSDVSFAMDFVEFQNSVKIFSEKIITDILANNKKLKNNSIFKKVVCNGILSI